MLRAPSALPPLPLLLPYMTDMYLRSEECVLATSQMPSIQPFSRANAHCILQWPKYIISLCCCCVFRHKN
jgi:hypothetical protein